MTEREFDRFVEAYEDKNLAEVVDLYMDNYDDLLGELEAEDSTE